MVKCYDNDDEKDLIQEMKTDKILAPDNKMEYDSDVEMETDEKIISK